MCIVNNSHGIKSHFIRSTLPHYHCKICMHVNVWYLGSFFFKPHDFYYTYFTQPDIRARILIDLKTEHKGNSSRFPQVLNFTQLCTEIIILMNDVRHEHFKTTKPTSGYVRWLAVLWLCKLLWLSSLVVLFPTISSFEETWSIV